MQHPLPPNPLEGCSQTESLGGGGEKDQGTETRPRCRPGLLVGIKVFPEPVSPKTGREVGVELDPLS